jgi:glycoprotein endo-alpha-1,2-mannosidase
VGSLRTTVGTALLAATLAATAKAGHTLQVEPSAPTAGEVGIFYYPWYGTPIHDGRYLHWTQNGATPPATIASGYFPARGAYSSSDRLVLSGQMDEISAAGVTTVIVSWWGPGSTEDARLDAVVAAARPRGLKVAAHVEPYRGRTPAGVASDLARLRERGIADAYVYDSIASPDEEWAAALRGLRGVRVFANTGLPGKALAGGFHGLYTYDVLVHDGSSFGRMCASARRLGLLCAPSVGPGFDARRATGDSRVRPRLGGATYDRMWRAALRAQPDVVTVTSYNEWHEGTQIEPARIAGGAYDSYEGAYGLTGSTAERAYLERTAYWSERYATHACRQYSAVASLRR